MSVISGFSPESETTGSPLVVQTVLKTILDHCLLSAGDTLVIGVSGGPDSLCLLHILRQLQSQLAIELHVAHLNHSLRGKESDADAEFVANLAREWNLPVTVDKVDVPALARSQKIATEEAARCARYAFLARTARHVGAAHIAVAHNADDQTETVLMHWIRGSGLSGLRGMLPATRLSEYRLLEDEAIVSKVAPSTDEVEPGHHLSNNTADADLWLIRPLLKVSRTDIEAYCESYGLQPRHDRSNLDTTYFRNRLRHELIPQLETYNPNIKEVIRRAADVAAGDYEVLRRELARVWPQVVHLETPDFIRFHQAAWQALPVGLKRSTLREAIHRLRHQLRNINFVHIDNALAVAQRGETGTQATLPQNLMLTVGYTTFDIADEDFVALPDLPLLLGVESLAITVPGRTPLPDTDWVLNAQPVTCPSQSALPEAKTDSHGRELDVVIDGDVLGETPILRRRRAGDRFCPLGLSGHSKRVNDFLINEKVPAPWREFLPLLVNADQTIVWIAGWRIDHHARISPETYRCIRLYFEHQ